MSNWFQWRCSIRSSGSPASHWISCKTTPEGVPGEDTPTIKFESRRVAEIVYNSNRVYVCVCVCSEYRTPLACYGKRCIYTKIVVSTRGNHICLLTDLGPARILRWIHFPVCVSWQLIINGELLDSPLVARPLLGRCYHLILNLVAGSVMIATRTLVYSLDCLLALWIHINR